MANYTSEEVQAAVEKIVRSTVRHPTGILGERQINVAFSDLQEAAAGVYILYFNAPFYTLLLGARRLIDLVKAQASTAASLIDAVATTNRLVTPVSDLSPLANARSALLELEAAVSSRAQSFQDIQKVPAFRRYAQNVSQFLQTAGSNVKAPTTDPSVLASLPQAGGEVAPSSAVPLSIADTPAGARKKIPTLARQLRDQHDELIRRARLLAGAIEDFSSLNLPRIAAQGVISRSRQVLDDHFEALSAKDENTRLEDLRAVVLDLLTQQPIVEKYGAAVAPSEFITTKGQATAFSDGTHLASPAALESERFGPYPILETAHFLKFTMDGGTPFEFPLPLAVVAEITGTLKEPFDIQSDRDALRIVFDDPDAPSPLTFNIALTTGTRTAAEVAAEINAEVSASDLVCERVFSPTKYASPMTVLALGGLSARFTILAGNLNGLGIVPGDALDLLTGPNAGTTWSVFGVDPGGTYLDATGALPPTPVGLPGVSVEVGPAQRVLRLRDTQPAASLAIRRAIRLPRTGGDEDLGAAILGFVPGMESRSRPVAAKDVAANLAFSSAKLMADAVFEPTHYEGPAHASSTDASLVVLAFFASTGTVTAGLNVTFNLSTAVENVGIGDHVVIRSSVTAADIDAEGVITAVTDSSISATMESSVTAGAVGIEVGPALTFGFGAVFNILDGVNQGRYVVRESQGVGTTCSFEVLLDSPLPIPTSAGVEQDFNVTFGQEAVRFKSRLKQISSSVRVENGAVGNAAELFFVPSSLPASARGTTPWFKFESFPSGAALGDLLQLFETQYNLVSREFGLVGIEQGTSLVKMSPEIESTASFSFDFDAPVPFGRIRVAQVADYTNFKSRLESWLALPEQQDAYFSELARFLNPLLVNQNPTVAQVDVASNQLKRILAVLSIDGATAYGALRVPSVTSSDTLEFALSNYNAPAEEPVDTLLATFRDKGSDRAVDLLTEGRFSDFFNLTMDGMSYSGTLAQGLREVARNDLPVRKFNRRSAGNQTLLGTIPQEKDFEFSADDADSPDAPDIPAAPDVASPGENF